MLSLHNTRLQLEKFIYKQGINAALYYAEQSDEYKSFKKDLVKALMAQINYVADYKEHLPLLMSLAKASSDPLSSQIETLLSKVTLANGVDLQAYLVWAGTQGGQAALDKLELQGIFGLKNQALIDYFGQYSNLLIDTLDDTTKKFIAKVIQDGKDQGLTPFEIQQLLVRDGTVESQIRAERIVLTETAKAMTTIEKNAASRYGIQTLIWRTSLDDRVDPICLDLEGKESSISKSFPGGYDGPPAHVSCRCYLEEVIPTDWVVPSKIWLGE